MQKIVREIRILRILLGSVLKIFIFDYRHYINVLKEMNKVKLIEIPVHKGISGNKITDSMAREASHEPFSAATKSLLLVFLGK